MPKADKISNPAAKNKPLYAIAPWSCIHHRDHSVIEAYVEAAGNWETIAEVQQTSHINAEATASFIVSVINDYEKMRNLIAEMVAALEICLECKGLNWSAEHDAEVALRHARSLE